MIEPRCICDGVTLTPRQWLLVRTLLSVRGGKIVGEDMGYANNPMLRREIDPTEAEFADLVAKLTWGAGELYRCPEHPERRWPPAQENG